MQSVRQQMTPYLKLHDLDLFLTAVRQGADPCPSDLDILNALITLAPCVETQTIRTQAQQFTRARLARRKAVAERQRRKQVSKLRQSWFKARRTP